MGYMARWARVRGAISRMNQLGLWTADLFGRVGLIVAELLAIAHLAFATWCSRKWFDHTYPGVWWFVFGMMFVVWTQLASKCSAERERKIKEEAQQAERKAKAEEEKARQLARQHELDSICHYKAVAAGNLARFTKALVDGTAKKDAHALQSALLQSAVDIVKDYLDLDRRDLRIAATWTVPTDDYTKWEVVAYDRNQRDRQPGSKRDIMEGIPGASEAFLTGRNQYIEDSLDEKVAKWFPQHPPYRSIVSVPACIVNPSREISCRHDGRALAIIGVLNVDCSAPNVLTSDIDRVVGDVAYLLAVSEHLKKGR